MNRPSPDLPKFLENQHQLKADERFQFACHPGVPCFNTCCSDVNIILTPLDVLQLARASGMGTREFLETRTANPITKDLELPLVLLKMGPEPEKKCYFLGENGCTVYSERPWACRMYPIGMAVPPSRAGESPEPIYFVLEDDFCKGRFEKGDWSAEEWIKDQNITERDEIETGFRDLMTHPWFIGGRKLDPKRMHMFYTSCYDLDTFRSFVFESSFCDRFDIEADLLEEMKTNDIALLRFAFRWLRFAVFGEPTVKVKEGEQTPRSEK